MDDRPIRLWLVLKCSNRFKTSRSHSKPFSRKAWTKITSIRQWGYATRNKFIFMHGLKTDDRFVPCRDIWISTERRQMTRGKTHAKSTIFSLFGECYLGGTDKQGLNKWQEYTTDVWQRHDHTHQFVVMHNTRRWLQVMIMRACQATTKWIPRDWEVIDG